VQQRFGSVIKLHPKEKNIPLFIKGISLGANMILNTVGGGRSLPNEIKGRMSLYLPTRHFT